MNQDSELEQLRTDNTVLFEALQGLMRMNQELLGSEIFTAFRDGKYEFHMAWLAATKALVRVESARMQRKELLTNG